MEHCDVAIIGGGIAGLSLGKFLAEKGIPFTLFEEHDGFFKKACGEGFVLKTCGYDFYDLYGEKQGIEKEIHESCVHTHYDEIPLCVPIAITDKKIIEETLAAHARKQGELKLGEKVERIEHGVLLPQNMKPKIIVGADGLFSLVRKQINNTHANYSIAAAGQSTSVPFDPDKAHVIMDKSVVKNGYAWFFPKRQVWNIGIGSWKHSEFKQVFDSFKKEHAVAQWRGAFIPYDKPIKPYRKNMLLLGDSAAHVVANLGEGNMPAMIAAHIAADTIETIAKQNYRDINLSGYHHECTKTFGRYLKRSYRFSRVYYSLIKSEYIRYKILKKVCALANKYYQELA